MCMYSFLQAKRGLKTKNVVAEGKRRVVILIPAKAIW
jgi:hypothetical protein